MIRIPRWPMATSAYLLGLMNVGLGLYWSSTYQKPSAGILAAILYLLSLSGTVLGFRELNIPSWQGLANLLVAAFLPRMVEPQVTPEQYGTYATWYIGALGVLLGATALRGQVYFAWGGLLIATAEIMLWEGPQNLLLSGWIGLVMLVMIGHAANLGMTQAQISIQKATEEVAQATITAARAETARETQLKMFSRSVPTVESMLRKIIAQKGKLSEDDRREALMLESELSDDIMGGDLLTKSIGRAARSARLRGVEVYLVDEGGLAGLEKAEIDELQHKIEDVINKQLTGKVAIRATSNTRWRVSITAYERGSKVPIVDWKF
jgi:hypothetical protein